MPQCSVAVGSLNPTKVYAVKRAFRILCEPVVKGVRVGSGVPSQPIGLSEILLGAINRAKNAIEELGTDYGVGIEAGVMETVAGPLELQVAAILDRELRISIGLSQAFPLPRRWLSRLRERVELEAIVAEELGRKDIGEKLGFIGYLTHGLVTRTDLSYNAVLMALVPRLNHSIYAPLPHLKEVLEALSERT